MLLHFRYLILVLLQDVFDEKKSSFRKWLFDILFKLFILKKNPKLMVYQMTGIATGSLFLVSFSFLSNFRICKDNVNCIPDKKPWPCFDLVLS